MNLIGINMSRHNLLNGEESEDFNDGPFEWVETIDGQLFGLRPGALEAEEIAGMNKDGSWNTCRWDEPPTKYRHLVIFSWSEAHV